jgi:hypothetical protein
MWFDEDIEIIIGSDVFVNVSGVNEFSQIDIVEVDTNQDIIIVQTSDSTSPVQSVNGKIGFVNINKTDIGLSNVENISIINTSGYLQNQINSTTGDYYPNSNPNNFISSAPPTGVASLDVLLKYVTGIETGITSYDGVFPNIYFTENPVLFISLSYENTDVTSINDIPGKNRYFIDLSYRNQTGFGVIFSDQISETGINLNVLAYGKGVNL